MLSVSHWGLFRWWSVDRLMWARAKHLREPPEQAHYRLVVWFERDGALKASYLERI